MNPCTAEEYRLLKILQSQWGILGLSISRSILRLEATLKEFKDLADLGIPAVLDTLTALHDQLNAQLAPPLAHSLRLTAGYFNDLLVCHKRKLARAVCGPQLAKWLKETPESTSALFDADISGVLEATRAQRTDGLISIAYPASHHPPPTASASTASSKGSAVNPIPLTSGGPFAGRAPKHLAAGGASPAMALEAHIPALLPVPRTP